MATPIKETPILSEKEWWDFIERVEENRKRANPISLKEYHRIKSMHQKIMEKAEL